MSSLNRDMCSWCIYAIAEGAQYGLSLHVVGYDLLSAEDQAVCFRGVDREHIPTLLDVMRRAWRDHEGMVRFEVQNSHHVVRPPITTYHGDPICPPHLIAAHQAAAGPTTVRMAQWGPRRAG